MSKGKNEAMKRRDFGQGMAAAALISAALGARESDAEETHPQGEQLEVGMLLYPQLTLLDLLGPQTVLGIGSVIGLVLLMVGLIPRSTRELGDGPPLSAEQALREVKIEARSKA